MPPRQATVVPAASLNPLARWQVLLPPLLILGAAVALALASLSDYDQAQRADFEQESHRVQDRIQMRVQDYELMLRGGLGLLNNSPHITGSQWRGYVRNLDYARRHPGAVGLGFSPHVPGDQLRQHERERQAESPGYAVYPPGRRDDYCPVAFLEPLDERNRRAIGFDLYSEPVRRACLDRARDTGEASLTGKLLLVQETQADPQPGCLLYVPLYRQGLPTSTVAQRRAALRGFVASPFRMHNLLASAVGHTHPNLGFALYDGRDATPEALFYRSPQGGPVRSTRASVLEMYGQQWTLVFTWSQESLLAPGRREPLVLLFLGAVLAGAVSLMVRKIAQARAQGLYQAMFEGNRSVCLLADPKQGRILDANPAACDFYGYSRQELQGKPIRELNTLEPGPLAAIMAEAGRAGGVFDVVHRLKDGSLRHVQVHAGPFVSAGTQLTLSTVQDVTTLRETERKLAQSHQFLQTVIDILPVPFFCKDAQGRYLLANTAYADLLGAGLADIPGRSLGDFAPEEIVAEHTAWDRRLLEPGAPQTVQYEVSRPAQEGGPLRHWLVFKSLLPLPDSDRPGIACISLDNTDRKDAQERLAQGHQFLQTVIDTLPNNFFFTDAEGRFLMANTVFAALLGLPMRDILGRTMAEMGRTQGLELHQEQDRRLLANPGAPCQYEVSFLDLAGRQRQHLVSKTLVPVPGQAAPGILGTSVDITGRKEAERTLDEERRRLADVIEGTNVGTWEWRIRTGEIVINQRWAEIVGYSMEELAPVSIKTWQALAHPEDLARSAEALERHFAGQTPFYDCECRMRHKDGHWVWVHDRGRVFRFAEDGSPLIMSGTHSDISARKHDEERLELVARFPVENPHPVLRADSKGTLLFANPAAEPLLKDWGQGLGGRLPDELRRELRQALASGLARTSERAYASGTYSVTISPFVAKGYANIYCVDVTQRKTAELALRQGERRFRELAAMLRLMCDNVPDMIWAKDMESRYLFANKAMCEQFLGVKDTEEPLGKTDRHFLARIPVSGPDAADGRNSCETGAGQNEPQGTAPGSSEWCGYVHGRYACYDVRQAPLVNDRGVVIGSVGAARNITERKTAEEALARSETLFRTLAQVSPVGIFRTDAAGLCLYANERWSRITGHAPETALGEGWKDALHPEDRQRTAEAFQKALHENRSYEGEDRFRSPDGRDVWVLCRAEAERDAEGRVVGYVGAVTDITDQKRAELALRQAKTQAEAATRAKAQFLANMSHEIRTPLAGVVGATRLLKQSLLDEDQSQLAEMASESAHALLDVVNDILDFSKIEAGQMRLRAESFGLRRLVQGVAAPYALLARDHGLRLDVDVAPDAPDALKGDEVRLGQVLRNLLGNALKFTETGGITLSVTAQPGAGRQVRLLVRVSDTGIGIEPGYLPQIFDSFSQADSSYGKQHGGTGLGLAICKNLVEQMGGGIQAQSAPGQGSTFTFSVLLARDDQGEAPAAPDPQAGSLPEAAAPEGAAAHGLEPLRVLLAEDNAISRLLMEQVLKSAGYTVASAANGREALRTLREKRFDLVLMDVQMPDMDGLTATRMIREGAAGAENTGIALVALTAYASREDRRHFLEAGLDEAVAKPAEEGVLFAAMERALRLAQDRRQGSAPDRAAPDAEPAPATGPQPAPRWDQGYIERSYGRQNALLGLLLRQFKAESLPELRQGLARALKAGDLAAGRGLAHKARGSLTALGAALGAQLAMRTEDAASRGDARLFEASARALLAELDGLDEHLRRGLPWGREEEE